MKEPTEKAKRTWVLALTSVASFMVALDALVVTTALNTMRADLGASIEALEWTVNAYNLSFAVLLLTGAALGDRWGRRRFLLVGTVLPVASYAIFATTTDVPWLFGASLLGGVGIANGAAGALTIATYDALLADHTTEATRTRVFAASGAILPKSHFSRLYFSTNTGFFATAAKPFFAPSNTSAPKLSSTCTTPMRSMPIRLRCWTARSASRW